MTIESSQLIAHYEKLAQLTEQMRTAAVEGDWDRLVELELCRNDVVEKVKSLDTNLKLDQAEIRRKGECISRVINQDGMIRELVQKHMGQIQINLASDQNTQRLRHAYGV